MASRSNGFPDHCPAMYPTLPLLQQTDFPALGGAYMNPLRQVQRPGNLCRSLISVEWKGTIHDCDFNQMLGLPLRLDGRPRTALAEWAGRETAGDPIRLADPCYGCTTGQGCSCGGAL